LILLNDSYAKFVYGHGNMEQSNIEVVAGLVVVGLLALPLQGVSSFLTSVFNARNDTKMPLLLNAAGLIFFLVTNRFGIFGEGLISLMWGIVASYGLICCLQFMLLKIENFRWRDTLFDASFCLGCLTAIAFSAFFCSWVSQLGLSAWASLMSACFFALLSIFIMALFNKHIRSTLKTRLVNK
jgi:O-antigen/teichoic acid export membrane protein